MNNKKILITGASGKLGCALIQHFAHINCQLMLCSNSNECSIHAELDTFNNPCATIYSMAADLSDVDSYTTLVAHAKASMGGITDFIHCASIFEKQDLLDIDPSSWHKQMDVNLTAPFFLCRDIGQHMTDAQGGHIILLSDIAATCPYEMYMPYSIAKSGMNAMVKGLAKIFAPNVTVNGIAPYIVAQQGHALSSADAQLLNNTYLKYPTQMDEICSCVDLLMMPKSSMTGQVITLDAGRSLK